MTIVLSSNDFRHAARRRLPPFLFHYIDGGADAKATLARNVNALQRVGLRHVS